MRYLLAAARLAFIVSGTTVIWAGAAVWSTPAPALRRRERRALAFQWWARYVLWVMGVDVRCTGALAAEPHLLVSNHLSYIDILVLASTGDVTFVAKHEVASWPLVGSMCRFVDTIFVRRSGGAAVSDALDAIARVLTSGRTVVLFPEGTSSDGREVLPFHAPLLEAARRAGRPLGWSALAYETPNQLGSETETVCWWGEMTLAGHLWRLLQLPAVEAEVTFGDLTEPGADRKALAADLRSAIAAARRPGRQRDSIGQRDRRFAPEGPLAIAHGRTGASRQKDGSLRSPRDPSASEAMQSLRPRERPVPSAERAARRRILLRAKRAVRPSIS